MKRLRQWCEDATAAGRDEAGPAKTGPAYRFVYVDQKGFERNPPGTFSGLARAFAEYQQD